jgi:ribosomal-protein-alanine N-acetyltransferase
MGEVIRPIVIVELLTESLKLILQTPAQVLARIDAMPPADRAQVSPDWLARARATTSSDPWIHGFAIVHQSTRQTIGSCAYKGPPDSAGMVEIAYGVDPSHRGRGYATEAARALTSHAFSYPDVRTVRAHTLPHENASTRVLTKCGFTFAGQVIDPEDGPVWRWEILFIKRV